MPNAWRTNFASDLNFPITRIQNKQNYELNVYNNITSKVLFFEVCSFERIISRIIRCL